MKLAKLEFSSFVLPLVVGSSLFTCACGSNSSADLDAGVDSCAPLSLICVGDEVVQCDSSGTPSEEIYESCGPGLCESGQCQAEDECLDAARSGNSGCEFYAVDLPQSSVSSPGAGIASEQQFGIAVANPWDEAIEVRVERNDGQLGSAPILVEQVSLSIAAESLVVIPLPAREVSGYVAGSSWNQSHRSLAAYRVETSRPATAYQFNPLNNSSSYSNDASMLIPVPALDENYLVLSWPGKGELDFLRGDNKAFVTVVGTEPNTRIRIVPSDDVLAGDNIPAIASGESFTATIDAFESINLLSGDSVLVESDLTGTRIEADKPIAVWTGVECGSVTAACCCDHLEEQLYPHSTLGKDYVIGHSPSRGNGSADHYRVMGLANATAVETSLPAPNHQFTLERGELRSFESASDFSLSASSPVIVGQFLVGQDATQAQTGDPSFVLVPPVEQFRQQYIVYVPADYQQNSAILSLPTGAQIQIDGAMVNCQVAEAGSIGGTPYQTHRCPLSGGNHEIVGTAPFGLVVMGNGPGPVSYAYAGGMNFKAINEDCQTDEECPDGFCSGGRCVDQID